MDERRRQHRVIPVGTKVLTRIGERVGLVAEAPTEPGSTYRVMFATGEEGSFDRRDLSVFRQVAREVPGGVRAVALRQYIQFQCVIGSRAYGLDTASSDTDRRGFYLPPAHLHWGLAGVPEQLESDEEECYWEIEKFLRLGLQANPNVLECMYSPLVEVCSPLAEELIAMRSIFLSRHIHRTYNAYVLSQFKKLDQGLRSQGVVRWKHAMHLIRLLLSGIVVLTEGFLPLRVDENRDRLLAIRKGEVRWSEVESWRLSLQSKMDEALRTTILPENPDYGAANDYLVRARRHAAMPGFVEESTC